MGDSVKLVHKPNPENTKTGGCQELELNSNLDPPLYTKKITRNGINSHFNSAADNPLHIYIKTNQLQCEQCKYSNVVKSNLMKHINIVHDKIKKPECEYCE